MNNLPEEQSIGETVEDMQMKDENKRKGQLIKEWVEMSQWVAELKASETERKRAGGDGMVECLYSVPGV